MGRVVPRFVHDQCRLIPMAAYRVRCAIRKLSVNFDLIFRISDLKFRNVQFQDSAIILLKEGIMDRRVVSQFEKRY